MHRLSDLTDNKLTKSVVKYTDKGTKKEHCSICEYYLGKGICKIVHGKISPDGWCNRFEKHG